MALEKRDASNAKSNKVNKRIGVHCLAGLGRAPFFVALAFVNNGCSPQNAIDLIRKHRPGAFNLAQAYFILEFKDRIHFKCIIPCFYSEKLQKQIENSWRYKKI